MNFMLCPTESPLISRFQITVLLVVFSIGAIIECTHAGVIQPEAEPSVRSMVVDTFKRKILDHLGLDAPPSVRFTNETLAHAAIREQIKDFLRRMRENESRYESKRGDEIPRHRDREEPAPLRFQSSERSLQIPISREPDAHLDSSNFIIFRPNNLGHMDTGSERIEFKSAVLRLRIGHRRKRGRYEGRSYQGPINVTVSFALGASQKAQSQSRLLLKSFIVLPVKSKVYQIDLGSHLSLLSGLMYANNNEITLQISVREMNLNRRKRKRKIRNTNRRIRYNFRRRHHTQSVSSFIQIVPKLRSTIVTKHRQRSRTKRQTSGNYRRSNGFCRRQSIYISFAEIGWDSWILSPDGYTAYYCTGSCPRRYKAASAFTVIKSMLHELNPSRIPQPSCAPTGYRPISLLYLGPSDDLIEADYPDMLVTGCRCF